jgi:hypothetical protein
MKTPFPGFYTPGKGVSPLINLQFNMDTLIKKSRNYL